MNPDVDPKTHPYISTGLRDNKFGVSVDDARRLYALAAKDPALEVTGIACHIGSQITTVRPFLDAIDRVLALARDLGEQGIRIGHLDVGGGLGITYKDEDAARTPTSTAPPSARRSRGSAARCSSSPGACSSGTPASSRPASST